ncbi:hypothetical protein EUX98_g459 [Antrodiella citrinella]|uniref:Uncharacterized protein n=1 Tax=Antrodiella citrinella TaxID=2447956 RepID=A0A4S4N719_9APHY|nr:hypothetical protein EUX98_g459 [Antrodiella citrinella]
MTFPRLCSSSGLAAQMLQGTAEEQAVGDHDSVRQIVDVSREVGAEEVNDVHCDSSVVDSEGVLADAAEVERKVELVVAESVERVVAEATQVEMRLAEIAEEVVEHKAADIHPPVVDTGYSQAGEEAEEVELQAVEAGSVAVVVFAAAKKDFADCRSHNLRTEPFVQEMDVVQRVQLVLLAIADYRQRVGEPVVPRQQLPNTQNNLPVQVAEVEDRVEEVADEERMEEPPQRDFCS